MNNMSNEIERVKESVQPEDFNRVRVAEERYDEKGNKTYVRIIVSE